MTKKELSNLKDTPEGLRAKEIGSLCVGAGQLLMLHSLRNDLTIAQLREAFAGSLYGTTAAERKKLLAVVRPVIDKKNGKGTSDWFFQAMIVGYRKETAKIKRWLEENKQ